MQTALPAKMTRKGSCILLVMQHPVLDMSGSKKARLPINLDLKQFNEIEKER